MIELYGMTSPNVLKIVLMLEETKLPYRFNWINVWKGEQFGPDFRRLNPNSKVPVIVDPEGPGGETATLFESGAILIYLAEKAGMLLPREGLARYDVLQWLVFQLTGVGPNFGQHVHFTRFQTEGEDYARARYTTEARRLVEVAEERLATSPYLGGEAYSIADVSAYPWLRLVQPLGLVEALPPALARWVAEISERPAAQKLQTLVTEMMPVGQSHRSEAGPEDLDRMFGRGKFARAG